MRNGVAMVARTRRLRSLRKGFATRADPDRTVFADVAAFTIMDWLLTMEAAQSFVLLHRPMDGPRFPLMPDRMLAGK